MKFNRVGNEGIGSKKPGPTCRGGLTLIFLRLCPYLTPVPCVKPSLLPVYSFAEDSKIHRHEGNTKYGIDDCKESTSYCFRCHIPIT